MIECTVLEQQLALGAHLFVTLSSDCVVRHAWCSLSRGVLEKRASANVYLLDVIVLQSPIVTVNGHQSLFTSLNQRSSDRRGTFQKRRSNGLFGPYRRKYVYVFSLSYVFIPSHAKSPSMVAIIQLSEKKGEKIFLLFLFIQHYILNITSNQGSIYLIYLYSSMNYKLQIPCIFILFALCSCGTSGTMSYDGTEPTIDVVNDIRRDNGTMLPKLNALSNKVELSADGDIIVNGYHPVADYGNSYPYVSAIILCNLDKVLSFFCVCFGATFACFFLSFFLADCSLPVNYHIISIAFVVVVFFCFFCRHPVDGGPCMLRCISKARFLSLQATHLLQICEISTQ
jgi:hypothetical protein